MLSAAAGIIVIDRHRQICSHIMLVRIARCGSRSEFGSRTGHYGEILFSRNMFPHIFPCRLTGAFNTFPKGPSDQLPYASINMSSSCKGCHLKHVPEGSVVTIWYILGPERRYVGTSVALPYTYMDSLGSYLGFLDSRAPKP